MRILLLAGFLCFTSLSIFAAEHPFLPLTDGKTEFLLSGEHWSDTGDGEGEPISAKATLTKLASFPEGEVLELKIQQIGKPPHALDYTTERWLVSPDGSISYINTGEDNANIADWIASGHAPLPEPRDLIFPPLDESGYFVEMADESASKTDIEAGEDEVIGEDALTEVRHFASQWSWQDGIRETRITTDNGQTVLLLNTSPNGHFAKIVWQHGLGIIEVAEGYGAMNYGFRLHRTVPAPKMDTPDIAALFAALPDEFIPNSEVFTDLTKSSARASLVTAKTMDETNAALAALHAQSWICDNPRGYLQISSLGDGEGQALEAALWKRKDGSCLIAIHLQSWSSGPNRSLNLRLIELNAGLLRDVTWSQLDPPSLADFYPDDKAEGLPPSGLIEGDWHLPREGTTITIEPGSQDAVETIDESEDAHETYRFELRWDGASFERIRLPRRKPS